MTSVQAAEKTSAGANPRAHWPAELQQELEDNRFSPIVAARWCRRPTSCACGIC